METLNSNIDTEFGINKPRLNNQVDKEVQRIFLPLNLMQILLLNPKYYIKNHFIQPNSCLNKFISISGVIFFVAVYVNHFLGTILDDNIIQYSEVDFLVFAATFQDIFKCSGFIMNTTLHFVYSKKNVLFVLYFQQVHRFLSNATDVKRFIISSWISVFSIFMFFILMVIYHNLFFYKPLWTTVLYILFFAALDSNLIYAIRLINLLNDKVKLWNVHLLLVQRNGCSKLQTEKMFQAYDQILKCYNIVRNIYKLPVLFHSAGFLWQSLIDIHIVILFSKIQYTTGTHQNPFISILLCLFLIKNYVLHISLGLQLQAFYDTIKQTQDSCEFILASDCTDDEKKFCKNIQRLHRASFSKMTACGLFYIDVCHPLRLLSLLTHYTIVQLQFAFL